MTTPAKPRKKKRKKPTLAQKLAFYSPIKSESSAPRVIPRSFRMGIAVNV